MGEHSLVGVKASVMIYDEGNRKWVPSGSSQGVSKVHIYQHSINNTFRVVGHKLQDHEVVINCAILKGLKYNQATPTFHQWRDNRQVYGLNFSSKEEADGFASVMMACLQLLVNGMSMPQPKQQQHMSHGNTYPLLTQQHVQQQQQLQHLQQQQLQLQQQQKLQQQQQQIQSQQLQNQHYQQQQLQYQQQQYQQQQQNSHYHQPLNISNNNYQQQNIPNGYNSVTEQRRTDNRNNCYDNAIDTTSNTTLRPPTQSSPSIQPPQPTPPSPPALPPAAPAPPPPPPLPPISNGQHSPKADAPSSLALALKSATLRSVSKVSDKSSDSTDGNSGYASGTVGRSSMSMIKGSENVMSEMARKLKERRARAEGGEVDLSLNTSLATSMATSSTSAPIDKKEENGGKMGKSNGYESPRNSRNKRYQSLTGQESFSLQSNSGNSTEGDLEALKEEILGAVRADIQKAKMEIIEAFQSYFKK